MLPNILSITLLWTVCHALPLTLVSRIPVNHRKLTICTEKNPKRTAWQVFDTISRVPALHAFANLLLQSDQARKMRIGARLVRIRLQQYTPTVASNNSTVQVANPTSIHADTVMRPSPHRVTQD